MACNLPPLIKPVEQNRDWQAVVEHLRLPFSLLLLPIFLLAIAFLKEPLTFETIVLAIVLHLLVYPASNGFNSYFDKDEGPIGGIEKPKPVDIRLYWVANGLDALALLFCYTLTNMAVGNMVLVYILISRAYSHPWIRLKASPFYSTLSVCFFQGTWVFLLVMLTQTGNFPLTYADLVVAIVPFLMLLGNYPLTQVFQHEEDAKRGDKTLSLVLGVKGTYLWSGLFLGAGAGLFVAILLNEERYWALCCFILSTLPITVNFLKDALTIFLKRGMPNYHTAMKMSWISAAALGGAFMLMYVLGL